jgi:hypothetical protein
MSKLIGPKKSPRDFEPKGADWFHIVVNDVSERARAFDHNGKELWNVPALARGQRSNWSIRRGDTPPGLYRLGLLYDDYEKLGDKPGYCADLQSYGWYSWDLIDLEGQETGIGRSGIMLHGGGSRCGWPGAWEPYQMLFPTHGCPRMHNRDLRDKVLPLYRQAPVYLSVFQDAV